MRYLFQQHQLNAQINPPLEDPINHNRIIISFQVIAIREVNTKSGKQTRRTHLSTTERNKKKNNKNTRKNRINTIRAQFTKMQTQYMRNTRKAKHSHK